MCQMNEQDVTDVGLMAIGRSGGCTIAIDETLSGTERWFLQIEFQSIDLYFEIAKPTIVRDCVQFMQSGESSIGEDNSFDLGLFNGTFVQMRRDGEFADRFFLVISGKGEAFFSVSLTYNVLVAFIDS